MERISNIGKYYYLYRYMKNGVPVYIGKAGGKETELRSRIQDHKNQPSFRGYEDAEIEFLRVSNNALLTHVEALLINRDKPVINVTDNYADVDAPFFDDDGLVTINDSDWHPIKEYYTELRRFDEKHNAGDDAPVVDSFDKELCWGEAKPNVMGAHFRFVIKQRDIHTLIFEQYILKELMPGDIYHDLYMPVHINQNIAQMAHVDLGRFGSRDALVIKNLEPIGKAVSNDEIKMGINSVVDAYRNLARQGRAFKDDYRIGDFVKKARDCYNNGNAKMGDLYSFELFKAFVCENRDVASDEPKRIPDWVSSDLLRWFVFEALDVEE